MLAVTNSFAYVCTKYISFALTFFFNILCLQFHMVDATYRVKEARKQLYSENGRHPDDKEVAEATGLSMKRLSAVLLTPKAPSSLDQKMGFNMDLKLSVRIFLFSNVLLALQFLLKTFAIIVASFNLLGLMKILCILFPRKSLQILKQKLQKIC